MREKTLGGGSHSMVLIDKKLHISSAQFFSWLQAKGFLPKVYLPIWLVFLSLIFISPLVNAQPDLKLITEDWAPYNYEEGLEIKGFSTEVVRAVLDELGDTYPIEIFPGPRSDRMLDTLPNIMYFSIFRTPEREEKYKWIGPISDQAVYFYKRKGNPKAYRDIEDIKVASVTVPYKGLVADTVEMLGVTNVIKLVTREQQFALLFNNRAELLVNTGPLGVAYYLKKMDMPADALTQTPVKLLEFPLYIACSKEIPDSVIERWQVALDRVKASNKYRTIYHKYLYHP